MCYNSSEKGKEPSIYDKRYIMKIDIEKGNEYGRQRIYERKRKNGH